MQVTLKTDISKKTNKPYDYLSIVIKVNGKDYEIKKVFLSQQEKCLIESEK